MNDRLVTLSGILGPVAGAAALLLAAFLPGHAVLIAMLGGMSFVLLAAFFVAHFEVFREFSRKRATHFGLNSVLMVVLFIFLIVVFNLIIRQYYFRIDLSSTGAYSLAPQTRKMLQQLPPGVDITVFSQEGGPEHKRVRDLLEGYRYLNRGLAYAVVDPDRDPLRAQQYGVTQYGQIVVRGPASTVVTKGADEQTITNAIINATRREKKTIYFTRGYGERDPASMGRDGISRAAASLNALGYATGTLSLASVDAVPANAAVLVIAGPQKRYSRQDADKVREYLKGGGKVLAFFDPGYDADPLTSGTGIRVGDGAVVDPSAALDGSDGGALVILRYPNSPVARDFRLATVFPSPAPLVIPEKHPDHDLLTLVKASPGSRLVKAGATVDAKGEYVIAGASGSRAGREILLVFGSSGFATNVYFDSTGNGNLFLNCVNWLAGESELVSVTARAEEFIPVYLTPEQRTILFAVAPAGIPLAVFAGGAVVWWKRRRL